VRQGVGSATGWFGWALPPLARRQVHKVARETDARPADLGPPHPRVGLWGRRRSGRNRGRPRLSGRPVRPRPDNDSSAPAAATRLPGRRPGCQAEDPVARPKRGGQVARPLGPPQPISPAVTSPRGRSRRLSGHYVRRRVCSLGPCCCAARSPRVGRWPLCRGRRCCVLRPPSGESPPFRRQHRPPCTGACPVSGPAVLPAPIKRAGENGQPRWGPLPRWEMGCPGGDAAGKPRALLPYIPVAAACCQGRRYRP
jgi:hypothetical protein